MARRSRKQLSVLVIPDDGSRTLEFRLSYWIVRGGFLVLAGMLFLVGAGGIFYFRSQGWQHLAESLRLENRRLRNEVERVAELAVTVTAMKEIDQQLRTMLSPHVELPPPPYSTTFESEVPAVGDEIMRRVQTVVGSRIEMRQGPIDPRLVPSIWPVPSSRGWVTAEFEEISGLRKNMHNGIDIAAPTGTSIHAAADGRIVFAGVHEELGLALAVDHYGVYLTRYGHNTTLLVVEGEEVRKGQPIALVGNSGESTGPHLHYEVLENGYPMNPRNFLN